MDLDLTTTNPRPEHRPRRARARASIAAGVAVLGLAWAALAPPAAAQGGGPGSDPLDQVIVEDQPTAVGPSVLADGHVDIGPRFVDGAWTLMVHDDSVVPAVWRSLDDAVLQVGDDAVQVVPDDPTYDFVGVPPGTEVHVVPQVQRPGVVWIGWNTQDPEVLATIDRGATLTLVGVDGPGDLVMYLQSGNLAEPDVLWSSSTVERQPIWVEINTHTHANWIFTEPGAYLVQVEVAADLIDGRRVEDVATLRIAVGSATSTDDVRAATFAGPLAPPEQAAAGAEPDAEEPDGGDGATGVLLVVAVGAVVLVGAVILVTLRGRRAKQQAERARATGGEPGGAW